VPISDIPLFSMLRTKMHWHQQRQQVLSENVANADTPNFQARDLVPPKFDRMQAPRSGVMLVRTDAGHQAGPGADARGGAFDSRRNAGAEIRPTGNAVSLEDEMMKVAANQMDYQAATQLYARSLGLIKTALGRF
jgi:flagellar basal-body rod protein FlgB